MADNASRDENRVTTLLGVSSVDFKTPTTVGVNPITHALQSESIRSSLLTERYDIEGNIIYTGQAVSGSSESSSVWDIYKYDVNDMTAAYGKVATGIKWADRATETYT